ncbi:MAG: carboxypeptidase regulatory-like domain-containing protein [Elusimicrobiota bacterium]|nr:carboxypeptidase regulatory-like domain-containing protein [Elusimicrobiota bacterium]
MKNITIKSFIILPLFLSNILFSATLSLKVVDTNNNPLSGVRVMIAPIPEGKDEPLFHLCDATLTDTNGIATFSNLSAMDSSGRRLVYKIGFSMHRYLPTIKEQIVRKQLVEVRFQSDNENKDLTSTPYRLTPAPTSFQVGRLKFTIVDPQGVQLTLQDLVGCELRHKITDELTAFLIAKGSGPFVLDNVPPATVGVYKLVVFLPVKNEGAEVIVSTIVVSNLTTEHPEVIRLGYVSTARSEGAPSVIPSDIAFEGMVLDRSSRPVSGCFVVLKGEPYGGLEYRTMTDASGRFAFLRWEILPSTYSVMISKLGYNSVYDKPNDKGYWYDGQTRVVLPKYFLDVATGVIRGRLILKGEVNKPLPDAWITLTPERDIFQGPYQFLSIGERLFLGTWATTVSRGDGYFEFIGLNPGQYNLEINHMIFSKGATQYYWKGEGEPNPKDGWNWRYIYNYGSDQKRTISSEFPYYRTGDDRRIVITSDTFKTVVYSTASHILVSENTEIIEIDLPDIPLVTTATINGMIEFPIGENVDIGSVRAMAIPIDPQTHKRLEREPVYYDTNIHASYTSNQNRNDANLNIKVPIGAYYVDIKSDKWVPAKKYNTTAIITQQGQFWQLPTIKMIKAGRLEGRIKLPDGSYFVAKSVSGVHLMATIRAINIDADYKEVFHIATWVQDKTKFIAEGVPPGKYTLFVEIKQYFENSGSEKLLYPPIVVHNVRVSAGETTFVEIVAKDGVMCELIAPLPPDVPEVDYTKRSTHSVLGYGILAIPSDVVLKGNDILMLIRGEGVTEDKYIYFFGYDKENKNWQTGKLPIGKYNLYMVMARFYGPDAPANQYNFQNSPDEYLTVISKAENVNVKEEELIQGGTFQIMMGAGVMGSGIIEGRVKGKNIFLQTDAEKIKNNIMEFFKSLPTVMLYDLEGNWRGYAGVYPKSNNMQELDKWLVAIESGDVEKLNKLVNSDDPVVASPVGFYIDNLPAGKYILICETKNYPPVTKIVTVSTGITKVDINFDEDAPQGFTITGYIKDDNNTPVSEANVILTHRVINKKVLTDSNGKFVITGLPSGVYKIDVSKTGYATDGIKVSVGTENNKTVHIQLKKATGKIIGKIYVRESGLSKKNIFTGAKVVAYNETENVLTPGKYIPSIIVKTDTEGRYIIPDVIVGNTYYVFAFVPERPVHYKLVYVSTDVIKDIDFTVEPAPPRLKVIMKRTENPYVFKFIIESLRPLVKVPECYYSIGKTFDEQRKVRALPIKGPKNTYELLVELPTYATEEYYTLKIKGFYGMSEEESITETITFSQKSLIDTKKEVVDELAEGGSILIDDERSDNTETQLDPGTLIPEEFATMPIGGFLTSLPMFKMSKTSKQMFYTLTSRLEDITASDVYEIALSKAQVNKPFSIALNYDRDKVKEEELKNLRVYYYDPDDTQRPWKVVPGATTVDPLSGTVAVETDTLEPGTTFKTKKTPAKSVVSDGVYKINPAAGTSQKGVFAVFKVDPSLGAVYTGTEFKVYNFPNPFDLKEKNVYLSDVIPQNQTTKGTVIKYFLPKGKNGEVKFYIYNLAGELVKTIDEGEKTGGYCYYTEWDGTNDKGDKCASGVYILLAKLKGEKIGKPHKMVILK